MTLPSYLIDLRVEHLPDLERDVESGGLFVVGAQQPLNQRCEITFRFRDAEQVVDARVVFCDARGIGLELFVQPQQRADLLDKIRTSGVAAAEAAMRDAEAIDEPDPSAPSTSRGRGAEPARRGEAYPAPVHERVRNLSVAEQLRLAHHGEQQERVMLERLYGKTVWEALLRNPRITPPEVARIARMGALPRPLLETIVGNAVWLGVPEIRRSLLGNPRLATELIPRVLRLLPRHELKLVPAQLAYPAAVRDVARRMLRD
ncbi:MAG: hypothetical protein R3B48_10965 [Kofleriaceae bacterium]